MSSSTNAKHAMPPAGAQSPRDHHIPRFLPVLVDCLATQDALSVRATGIRISECPLRLTEAQNQEGAQSSGEKAMVLPIKAAKTNAERDTGRATKFRLPPMISRELETACSRGRALAYDPVIPRIVRWTGPAPP